MASTLMSPWGTHRSALASAWGLGGTLARGCGLRAHGFPQARERGVCPSRRVGEGKMGEATQVEPGTGGRAPGLWRTDPGPEPGGRPQGQSLAGPACTCRAADMGASGQLSADARGQLWSMDHRGPTVAWLAWLAEAAVDSGHCPSFSGRNAEEGQDSGASMSPHPLPWGDGGGGSSRNGGGLGGQGLAPCP